MRASDDDRDRVADRLKQAATEGRLSSEEFEQRLEKALGSRTYGQLDALVADLPRSGRWHRSILKAPLVAMAAISAALIATIAIPVVLVLLAVIPLALFSFGPLLVIALVIWGLWELLEELFDDEPERSLSAEDDPRRISVKTQNASIHVRIW